MLIYFNQPLWLAIRGVAGQLPFHAEATPDLAVKSDPCTGRARSCLTCAAGGSRSGPAGNQSSC